MTLLSIASVLFATVIMGLLATGKAGHVAAEVEVDEARPRALPRRWSSIVILGTILYFFLLLAGLSYAGWFHVA